MVPNALCGNSQPTVAHILNGCPVALEQGRYTEGLRLNKHKIKLTCSTLQKQNKEAYGILFSDMANQGWTVDYETLEMGSLGHYQREMHPHLSSVLDPTHDLCQTVPSSLQGTPPAGHPLPCCHF